MDVLALGLAWYIVLVVSITLHEAAHALAALKLGDPTAYQGGQVTLDPWPHIQRSPIGLVVAPLVSYVMAGWMIGWASAPYDPQWALRHPHRSAWMAAAGPAANLLLVILAGVVIRLGLALGAFAPPEPGTLSFTTLVVGVAEGWTSNLAVVLSILFLLNLLLLVFNLIPVPPLDGGAVLMLLFDEQSARKHLELLWDPTVQLVGIFAAWFVIGEIFVPVVRVALRILYFGA